MAELADAADLKSAALKRAWGFESPSRHQSIYFLVFKRITVYNPVCVEFASRSARLAKAQNKNGYAARVNILKYVKVAGKWRFATAQTQNNKLKQNWV